MPRPTRSLSSHRRPRSTFRNWFVAADLALILQKVGERGSARVLLDRSEQIIRTLPRLGNRGYGIADVQIHALRGDKVKALAACVTRKRPAGAAIGVTSATSTPISHQSATNRSSKPCSPTSSATWRASAPSSRSGRRTRHSTWVPHVEAHVVAIAFGDLRDSPRVDGSVDSDRPAPILALRQLRCPDSLRESVRPWPPFPNPMIRNGFRASPRTIRGH